jgi:hypothetical protein
MNERRQAMTKSSSIYVGVDVHKDSIDIAIADAKARGKLGRYGTVGGLVVNVLRIL